jgi:hypothetical protein
VLFVLVADDIDKNIVGAEAATEEASRQLVKADKSQKSGSNIVSLLQAKQMTSQWLDDDGLMSIMLLDMVLLMCELTVVVVALACCDVKKKLSSLMM